jgi:putative SOS response-associated peptidase YedK
MCGRFTNRLTWREIVALYRLSVPATPERNLPARYNICPTDTIDAVIEGEGKRELVPMRWGHDCLAGLWAVYFSPCWR